MSPQTVIRKKRDGGVLMHADIQVFVDGVVSGSWSRGQTGSMLMALFQRGMNLEETRLLLENMLHSGELLDMSGVKQPKVDKHSTGGVGDKVSIVLAPLAAACGLAVPMLSGRGLGHTGGTLDKMESIPGFNVFPSIQQIRKQILDIGCVMAGQTETIVPADKILYAMRDETATVEHPSLISASILSKKLAEGIDALLLDVKFGRGAFFKELEDASYLARLMVDLGHAAGCRTGAWLTRMDTPLGRTVGNAVEVVECIDILKGEGPGDLTDLIVDQVAGMLHLGNLAENLDVGRTMAREQLANGNALKRFARMVEAQGGDPGIIDNPALLPQARRVVEIIYEEPTEVHVADVDARAVAEVVLETGSGRRSAEDDVDHSTGISGLACVGDVIRPGGLLARLHLSGEAGEEEYIRRIRDSITLSDEPGECLPRIYKIIT